MSLLSPPDSMFFILLLSIIIAFVSVGLTKWLVDTEEIQRKQKQIKAHQEEKKRIIELAEIDVERYHKQRKKWERREEMLKKTQQGMAMQRLKPTCITFLPMLITFIILRMFFANDSVASTPMGKTLYSLPFLNFFFNMAFADESSWIGTYAWINFTAWYFICSLGINTLLQRIFKLQTQASGGMEQMFGGQKATAMQFPDV
ncbi:MAG: EMC3/TMCO1 family protein [Candidatus Hodarchaeota archaeon]